MAETIQAPYPPSLAKLVAAFSRLPGVGRRSAERMAFHFLKCPKEEAMELALALRDLRENLQSCSRCFNIAEADLCAICSNPARDQTTLCVVEMPRDVIALEKTGAYRGLYHVLLGRLAPTEGIEPENLKIAELHARVQAHPFEEIILATNPTAEGDVTATFLAGDLKPLDVRITRLARGLSAGAEIEFAAEASLQNALDGRSEI